MSTLTIPLPDSLRKQVERLAENDGIPVEQFLALAAAVMGECDRWPEGAGEIS